jgi:excisionase family DNA binding protein
MARQPVAPTAAERDQLRGIIKRFQGRVPMAQLVAPDGETIDLPDSVYDVLTQVMQAMAQGLAVAVMPLHLELTTQEAADLLNVSRQYLVQILDQGAIPYTKVGTHRRIRFGDLCAYKEIRDQQRRAGLDRLARLSAELGMYDEDFPRE